MTASVELGISLSDYVRCQDKTAHIPTPTSEVCNMPRAAAAPAPVPANPIAPPPSEDVPFYNVQSWIKANPKTDLVSLIQKVINQASTTGVTGSVVYFPAGVYALDGGLTVPEGITLLGAGWNEPADLKANCVGTWIQAKAGAPTSPITITGKAAAVRNIAFQVPDQPGDEPPGPAAPMISVTADQALVEDVFLYNPYCGISISGCAQAVIRRLSGQPLRYGIQIDASRDTNYIDCVHFWEYWSKIDPPKGQPPAAPAVFQRSSGTAVQLYRCDNPHISNFFAWNYRVGLALGVSPNPGTDTDPIPHKVHLVNADFDSCVTGIEISSTGSSGSATGLQLSNVTVQAPQGAGVPTGNGIWVTPTGSFALVQASNLRVSNSGQNAIRIDAPSVKFYGENVFIENWGSDDGFCISTSSSTAFFGRRLRLL